MPSSTLTLIRRFHDAFNQHDLEAVTALMTADCVFENTFPAPDGTRHEGQEAVRAAFAAFFAGSPHAWFEVEEVFATGEHAVLRWTYYWTAERSPTEHVRGVDIFRVRDGLVAEKLSYVKG